MDEDVLRALGADLERDDPGLAALLSGVTPRAPAPRDVTSGDLTGGDGGAHRGHPTARLLMLLLLPFVGVLTAGLLLPVTAVLGATVMLLILASPFAAAWLCSSADDLRPRRPR
jgi:hypothetical protein